MADHDDQPGLDEEALHGLTLDVFREVSVDVEGLESSSRIDSEEPELEPPGPETEVGRERPNGEGTLEDFDGEHATGVTPTIEDRPQTNGDSQAVDSPLPRRAVLNGLQLCLKGNKQAFVSYTYALTPFMDTPVRVDWRKILTTEGVECQHILCHELQPGDAIGQLAAKYRKAHAVALVLVNTDGSLMLSADFAGDETRRKRSSFPIVLISSTDGQSLRDLLTQHDPGEILAKIFPKSMAQVEASTRQPFSKEGSDSPSQASKTPTRPKQGGNRMSFRYKKSRRLAINLKEEVKQLMLPVRSGPECVSEDAGLFQVVMSTFYQHEQMVFREGRYSSCDGGVFRELTKHMEKMFSRDAPFYLLIGYRVHKKQHLYQCDELSPFVQSCVDRFERLEESAIARTLENFLKMDNFKIMFDSKDSTLTVFQLLEMACIEMMKLSFALKGQEGSHRHVYYRMLWISVACKCHEERGAREDPDYWSEHFIKSVRLPYLEMDTIQDLKKGAEFGRMLQLPDRLAFTSALMAEVLVPEGTARSFPQSREFLLVMEPYVLLEEHFLRDFLQRPRTSLSRCYQRGGEEGLRAVYPEGNLLVILQEGIHFLDCVLEVCRRKHWLSAAMDEEVRAWLSLLLQFIDVASERAESCLKDLVHTTKPGCVTNQYRDHIKGELVGKLEDSFGRLSVEQFLQLYKAFLIWPTWVVEKYLMQYKIPEGVRICSPTWNEFIAEFVERFTDAQHHEFLLAFMRSVAACYLSQGRAKDFVLDLLQLDVPSLFVTETEGSTSTLQSGVETVCVPDEFTSFLTDYIQRNRLQEAMLREVESIWSYIVDQSDFQQLVLLVLQQELIPASLTLRGALGRPLNFLLGNCVTTVCGELQTLQELSSRRCFCWGIIASCCSKIVIAEGFEWITTYLSVIRQLGRIYGTYCTKRGFKGDDCILRPRELPIDIEDSPSMDVKKFFLWVAKAQEVLGTWHRRFDGKRVNYDDIQVYNKHFSQINTLAVCLAVEQLVVDIHLVQAVCQEFLQSFEILNILLLRYIAGQPDMGWCDLRRVLSRYGVGLPSNLLLDISRHITFPGETNITKRALCLTNTPSASISKSFAPNPDIALEITRELDLYTLKQLVHEIDVFLSPLHESLLDELVYFFLSDSGIFDKYLKLQLSGFVPKEKPLEELATTPAFTIPSMVFSTSVDGGMPRGLSTDLFAAALKQTDRLLMKLLQGSASYADIVANGAVDLMSIDIDHEFEILNSYAEHAHIDMSDAEGLKGVKAMLQLCQLTRHIRTIYSVCVQYQLDQCLSDPRLLELVDLANTLEVRENQTKLTARDAIDKMERATSTLCLTDKQTPKYLDLFAAVADSAVFHQFVMEKQFVGEAGQALFGQQYQLITTQLQHEQYKESVLNHLFAAFKFITPFIDKEQSFPTLMLSVSALNANNARHQLNTVNRNINLIRLWFSRAEGDTLQGVAKELEAVLNTGHYQFAYAAGSTEGVRGAMELIYRPLLSAYVEEAGPLAVPGDLVEQHWNREQINDFVRKLGFLDSEGAVGVRINHFLHLHQTAKKLLDLYSRLRELGHPSYLLTTLEQVLSCRLTLDEADDKVQRATQTLGSWEQEVVTLRAQYEQLLYFTIPKLLHLYHMIKAMEYDVEGVVQAVSFLFQNKPHVRTQLWTAVEGLLDGSHTPDFRGVAGGTPMHLVGSFLAALFSNESLGGYSLRARRMSLSVTSVSSQSTHILHSCQGFSQAQLLRQIVSIYGGVPEAFEVFHCRPTTTKEELRLFLDPKRATKQPFQFLMLEVNRLPYQLQETLIRLHFDLKRQHSDDVEAPCVHFVETGPSLLQDMPWILHRDYKGADPALDFAQAMMTCKKSALNPDDFSCIQLVYGNAGDGKTHYVEKQLVLCPTNLCIAINEAFTPLATIKKLLTLPMEEHCCAVFFNFTLLPPGESVDGEERRTYEELIASVGWFFFDLFVLGYVEDPITGVSFRFPGGMSWAVYVEVPSRNVPTPDESLAEFYEDIPALGLLGTPHCIYPECPFEVDADVQLVCKYLHAHHVGGTKGIDRLFRESSSIPLIRIRPAVPVKFSLEADLSEQECYRLLARYTPQHMKKNKTTQKLFVSYMKRRCEFLDNCPAFNYNVGASEYIVNKDGQPCKNDTRQLGSTLMDTMLREVSDFCDPIIRENWALKPHHQLVYDFKDGGGTLGLLSLHPDLIDKEEIEKFKKIGVNIPSMMDLHKRETLDLLLSRALDVPLDENRRLCPVDESAYVMTLDFALKMLNIHERAMCGVPLIIEGETGVGKTALIEMLSKLWNYSLLRSWNRKRDRLLDFMRTKLREIPASTLKRFNGGEEAVAALTSGEMIRSDDLLAVGEVPMQDGDRDAQFFTLLRGEMLDLAHDPALSLVELSAEDRDAYGGMKFIKVFASTKFKNNPKDTAKLFCAFLNAQVKNTFYKLNVHAALQPANIMEFFEPVFQQAQELQKAYSGYSGKTKIPFVMVFLDEVNTSCCLGLLKEIIVDRTLDGKAIPRNIFIIGASNPHRGNSLAATQTWVRGTYYVRQLHPTLQCLMWDYGALGEQQERDYILAKMRIINQCSTDARRRSSNAHLANLTDLIVKSQNLMREYAFDQLKSCDLQDFDASACSRSCVSQRDIQRVFTFYNWLMTMYGSYHPHGEETDYNTRAVMVALGIVYYLRLDSRHRQKYREALDRETALSRITFSRAFGEELDWYMRHVDLPQGIARTQALKENVFANIVCTMTHTPLILVGQPGSSKTLSFNLTLANLKGEESKMAVFRNTAVFRSLDPHFYQCSRRTTSNEIHTVFSRAINRQRDHVKVPLPVYCVVFMDEAGLPEERHESLKVLHYFLDKQEVSFVAISNHVLDAAKTNRAVSLYRPEATQDELVTLAKGCLCPSPDSPPPELRKDVEIVARFCLPYETLMNDPELKDFFGLRDFIHFISYLRRKRHQMLSPQLVMEAVERNFNGVDGKKFQHICKLFLRAVHSSPEAVNVRSLLDVLQSSLVDHPADTGAENEVRYKLIIDPSEDGSLVRLLFSSGVLARRNTRVYVCSDFPGDAELQKVNTIAAVRHSATEGHTVVLSQTDAIHESFYELFNRRFHRIDASSGPRYYANISIGAHIKPCRVHHNFECVVVVKQSEVANIPAPFLNRFEKYCLSHEIVLKAALSKVPPALNKVIETAQRKVVDFVDHIGGMSSIYGLHRDTVHSLVLALLPPNGHEYQQRCKPSTARGCSNMKVYFLETLLQAIKLNAGFRIPSCSDEELHLDADKIFALVLRDSEFDGHFSNVRQEDILPAVTEALHALYHTVPPRTGLRAVTVEVSTTACMVVSVLTQWLVRHFVKQLLQLITSEAVCMHHRKIPPSYIQNYLNHQHHFSLKALLESRHTLVQSKGSSCPTKLLCLTRSSPLVHQLPTQHPSPRHHASDAEGGSSELTKELVFSDPARVVIHKLSTITTFTTVNELLRSFAASKSQQVLLLVVNMQETSKEVVNHLRIMIEEAEATALATSKVFTLLLHFPASRLSSPCYPLLYLRGWDFHYLDVIGYGPVPGVLDIRDWFKQCYASRATSSFSDDDSVTQQLHALLNEAIPVASAKVNAGRAKSSHFNITMSLPERKQSMVKLFEQGVGTVLCERFLSYWQPSVMVEYLEKAAAFANQHETAVNLIDSLHAIFKNLFVDFVVYMVSQMNVDSNIDVLFSPDCTPTAKSLFLSLLRIHPVPKLTELKMLRILVDTSPLDDEKSTPDSPRFPFFRLISMAMDRLVEQSRREINQQVDMLSDFRGLGLASVFEPSPKVQTMSDMVAAMVAKLEEICKSPDHEHHVLAVALNTLLEEEELWQRYLEDFTHQKLHLEVGSSGISHKILRAAFGMLEERSPLERLSILHVYVHIHKLNLARVVSVLRPLDRIEVAASLLPSLSQRVHSPHQSLFRDVEQGDDFLGKPEALSVFIIDTLFSAIAGINMSWGNEMSETVLEHLGVWYNVYRDMISMPTLRNHIYHSRSTLAEAQHNVMHAAFLVVRSSHDPEKPVHLQQTLSIFSHLLNRYFWTNLELRGAAGPRLSDIATEAVEALTGVKLTSTLSKEDPRVRHIVEGLLAHFFSESQSTYNHEDVQWFLEIANAHAHWQATYLMSEVVETQYSGDLLSLIDGALDSSVRQSAPSSRLAALGCVPMSTFKFYLHRILDRGIQNSSDPIHSIMLFFQQTDVHQQIADELCLSDSPDSSPESQEEEEKAFLGPYIPTYYQFCEPIRHCPATENTHMQQPLCHLYFLTVLESLINANFMLSSLVTTYTNITKQCEGGSVTESELILLLIERQAVAQAIIRNVAQHLDLRNDSKINTVMSILPELNTILDDAEMGGGVQGGHGLVLAMHLLKELQSFRRFHLLFTDQYTMLLDGINCLKPIHAALSSCPSIFLKQEPSVVLYADMGPDFQFLYQKVCSSMSAIHTSHGTSAKVKDFVRLAQECSSGDMVITSPSGSSVAWKKLSCFRMALWLATYNEFYSKNKHSRPLAVVIDHNLSKLLDSKCIQLLSYFLVPDDSRQRSSTVLQSPHILDPILSLFVTRSCGPEDPLVSDMRNALVHLIAVVLGCPPQSTHLWYHMFAPAELGDSYITGFMLGSKVGAETQFYDQGVELTDEGLFGQHGYIAHATRGTLSLHSLYLLLWVNFASFSVALLTQQNAEEAMTGTVFSEMRNLRHYCAYQVTKLWHLLRDGLAVSDDERSLLVNNCLNQLFELHIKSNDTAMCGRLTTANELDRYEEMWHSSIFTPQWNSLKNDFESNCTLIRNPVFNDIRFLDCRYPWFVTESTLTRAILSRVDVSDAKTNELYPLSRFVLEYPRLKIAGDLLPSIVELYQWLHSELSYAVTYDDAKTITLNRLAKVIAKRRQGETKAQYERLKATFNDYVRLTGCTKNKRPVMIADDTPLLHLLSYNVDGEQGNDLLHCVITDVITFHNQFLSQLLKAVESSPLHSRYCPEDVPKVHVMEFSRHYRLIGTARHSPTSNLLHLIHARCYLPLAFTVDPARASGHPLSRSHLPGQAASIINLRELQEDILQTFIAGKPLIDHASIASLRVPFKFKEDSSSTLLHLNLHDCVTDLNTLAEKLPRQLKVSLEEDHRKRVEYEFHSASYLNIMEVISGLKTAVAHLIRKTTTRFLSTECDSELQAQTLPQFLTTLYDYNSQDESRDVFQEIGIHSLTQTQHACLEELHMPCLFSIFKRFVHWAEEGWYSFSSLPFGVKMPMTLPDEDSLRQIPAQYEGSCAELLSELKLFVEMLVHLEASIVKANTHNPQLSLMRYLQGLQICNDRGKLIALIPESILLEHYVSLRLALRRLINEVQKDAASSDIGSAAPDENVWDDFASDLWETRLAFFRQRGVVYCAAPATNLASKADGGELTRSHELLNELIHYSSETNLLAAIENSHASTTLDASNSLHTRNAEASAAETTEQEGSQQTGSIPHRLQLKRLTSQVEEDLQQLASCYTVEDVVSFLEKNHLEHYATAFEEFDINGELLIQFGDDELKELKVLKALDRLKIRVLFKRLITGASCRHSPTDIVQFLKQNKQLKQFAAAFQENEIDGEQLLGASDEVFRELGVEKGVYMRMIHTRFRSYIA